MYKSYGLLRPLVVFAGIIGIVSQNYCRFLFLFFHFEKSIDFFNHSCHCYEVKNCVYVKCCVCVNVNYFHWINSKICHTIFQFWIFSVQYCVQMTHVSCYIFVRSRVPCVSLSYLFSFIFVYNFFFSRHLCDCNRV